MRVVVRADFSACPSVSSRRSFCGSSLLFLVALLAETWSAIQPCAVAAVPACGCAAVTTVRPQDRVWLISTRNAGCPQVGSTAPAPNLSVARFQSNAWQASDMDSFLAADDGYTRTVFYVHGNQNDAETAKTFGLMAYRAFIASVTDERPVQMVVWSWPSDRIDGSLLEDVRVKAERSDTTGYYLATVLQRLSATTPTTLIGFSYGARAITGALQLEAGGQVACYSLSNLKPHAAANVVLMAAAEDDNWLLPGGRNGVALSQSEHLLNIYNGCDRALMRYHFLYGRRCCAEALGYVGLASGMLPTDQQAKIAQYNACCTVGSEHDSYQYLNSASISALVRPYVFPSH